MLAFDGRCCRINDNLLTVIQERRAKMDCGNICKVVLLRVALAFVLGILMRSIASFGSFFENGWIPHWAV
jgi:hypothetical protein